MSMQTSEIDATAITEPETTNDTGLRSLKGTDQELLDLNTDEGDLAYYYHPRKAGDFHKYAKRLRELAPSTAYPPNVRSVLLEKNIQAVLDCIHKSGTSEDIKWKKVEDVIPRLEKGEEIEENLKVAYEEIAGRELETEEEKEQWLFDNEIRMDRRLWTFIRSEVVFGLPSYEDPENPSNPLFPRISAEDWLKKSTREASGRHHYLGWEVDGLETAIYNALLLQPYIHVLQNGTLEFDYTPLRAMNLNELMVLNYILTSAAHAHDSSVVRHANVSWVDDQDTYLPSGATTSPDWNGGEDQSPWLSWPKRYEPSYLRWGYAELLFAQRWVEMAYYDRSCEEFGEEEGRRTKSIAAWAFAVGWNEEHDAREQTVLMDVGLYPGRRGRYEERDIKCVVEGRVVEKKILGRILV